jgi:16S rRNA (uracil1498-N3)-methyltransferase
MHSFFADPRQISGDCAFLEGSEVRHIRSVLRLEPGDALRLVDGTGTEYEARITAFRPGRVELAVTGRRPAPGLPRLRLAVAQGFLKEKKMDRLVRQLSEIGASRLMPFLSGRTVARPAGARSDPRQARWRKIAVEALKQCRRGDLIAVEPVVTFAEVLAQRSAFDSGIFFWEDAAEPLCAPALHEDAPPPASVLVVLGPEGGFSPEEARSAAEAGFRLARMGPRVLRAETAAVTACALVQYLFGDLGPAK